MAKRKAGPALSAIDRLLAAPPPRPVANWVFHLTTTTPRHTGRKRWVDVNGIRLRYFGCADISECHDVYRLELPRDLARRAQADPLGVAPEIATLVDCMWHELSIECRHLTAPPQCPNGLCGPCWRQGRRTAGKTYFGRPFTSGSDLCDDHYAACSDRHELTEAP